MCPHCPGVSRGCSANSAPTFASTASRHPSAKMVVEVRQFVNMDGKDPSAKMVVEVQQFVNMDGKDPSARRAAEVHQFASMGNRRPGAKKGAEVHQFASTDGKGIRADPLIVEGVLSSVSMVSGKFTVQNVLFGCVILPHALVSDTGTRERVRCKGTCAHVTQKTPRQGPKGQSLKCAKLYRTLVSNLNIKRSFRSAAVAWPRRLLVPLLTSASKSLGV